MITTWLLIWVLHFSAGPDRRVAFDFELGPEHRGAIYLQASASSDVGNVQIVWRQIAGPRGFLSNPLSLKPALIVEQDGEYELWAVVSDGKEILSDTVKISVTSRK